MLDRAHQEVHRRRVQVLCRLFSSALTPGSSVLDVGTGDGWLASLIAQAAGVQMMGTDVLCRPDTHIPVRQLEGERLPFGDAEFDAVMVADVLHHADDPAVLFAESVRVSRRLVVIKDHLTDGFLAGPTLRFMDWVGNARYGVSLPHHYWARAQWDAAIAQHQLRRVRWEEDLGLYPWPASLVFGRRLHFFAVLEKPVR